MASIIREQQEILSQRLRERNPFIQVLLGPRQVGKTTIATALFEKFKGSKLFLSADDPQLHSGKDLNELWMDLQKQAPKGETLLVIDEIHKFPSWAEIVKARWDQGVREKLKIKVVILGSAPLLIQKGLSDSLAGRFECIYVPHWSYQEIRQITKLSIDDFIFYGAYPGSMGFIENLDRWKSYVKNSLIETTISRDIMLLTRIDKPALLRHLFYLACTYSGQILSYQKMTGQLQDAGNTTTLAHYLDLLDAVGFVKGLKKFTGSQVLTRSSSPKLQVYNTALLSALSVHSKNELMNDSSSWGRWVESAVGAHLLSQCAGTDYILEYWKHGNYEVDFILRHNKKIVAIEVKSGHKKERQFGLIEIKKHHSVHNSYVIGSHSGELPLANLFNMKLADFF